MHQLRSQSGCHVAAVASYLPSGRLDNDELARRFPEWSAEDILRKTGIATRAIAGPDECASDLGLAAAEVLFDRGDLRRDEVDALIFCSQSPDYLLPTTACLLQARLGLSDRVMALDLPLGCSGFVHALSLAQGLLATGQAHCILVVTADTYTRLLDPADRSVMPIFGDAGAATLVRGGASTAGPSGLGPFVFGSDGGGASSLIVEGGGARHPDRPPQLYMDGPRVFEFCLKRVPEIVQRLLERSEIDLEQVDLWVFHQANRFMLERLRKKIGIAEDRFVYRLKEVGNTVSATIPLALESALVDGRLQPGMRVGIVGFGVGLSWGAGLLRWPEAGEVLGGSDDV
ncbi:MAG: ketoacyl-ACP synthase III [Planctomycetes bacterium]|nr:ketoacyl-ACP synthase III [Planctomycetota bacterium]